MEKTHNILQKFFIVLFVALLSAACKESLDQAPASSAELAIADVSGVLSVERAFKQRTSDVQVEGKGEVVKLLSDDNKGSRHQRFLVRTSSVQTLLFAHNLDLAARVEPLSVGDTVEFKGEYVYNPKGGIVHWTHKDPKDQHQAGWIKHNGKLYQ